MTQTVPVRLSPSGKKLGPIHFGPGTTCRKWRAKGATEGYATVNAAVVPIVGLTDIEVQFRAGYLYDLDLYTTWQVTNCQDTEDVVAARYMLRTRAGTWDSTWSLWDTPTHKFYLVPDGDPGVGHLSRGNWHCRFHDSIIALPGDAAKDRLRVGVSGSATAGASTSVWYGGCHIVIAEYLAP
jgi:hypothetical protein